jgi:hypothetical protein
VWFCVGLVTLYKPLAKTIDGTISEAYREKLHGDIRKAGEVFTRPALDRLMCGF